MPDAIETMRTAKRKLIYSKKIRREATITKHSTETLSLLRTQVFSCVAFDHIFFGIVFVQYFLSIVFVVVCACYAFSWIHFAGH